MISLTKGQKVELDSNLSKIKVGLGWDVGGNQVDLDASCILFDEQNNSMDTVWFRQLSSRDGSIKHSGDNRTGAGSGDDEIITIDLSTVPANCKNIVVTINSFLGQGFTKVQNAFCRVLNANTNEELVRYNLSERGNHTAMIMAKVYRHNGGWKVAAMGEPATARTIQDLVNPIKYLL